MPKPHTPWATMLLTKLQRCSPMLSWEGSKRCFNLPFAYTSSHGQYYKCTYLICDLIKCRFLIFLIHFRCMFLCFFQNPKPLYTLFSFPMAGTTGEVNAKLSCFGEAESSWQQSGSDKKQRSGNSCLVLVYNYLHSHGGLDIVKSACMTWGVIHTCFIRCWTRLWSILKTCRTILTFATKRSNFEVSHRMTMITSEYAPKMSPLWYNIANNTIWAYERWFLKYIYGIHPSDPVERNSLTMKQEVTTLQEILNRLDFKRKASVSVSWYHSELFSVFHFTSISCSSHLLKVLFIYVAWYFWTTMRTSCLGRVVLCDFHTSLLKCLTVTGHS